jgi:5-bromo-4-chloroindolyl phosphate hydrolysis protein
MTDALTLLNGIENKLQKLTEQQRYLRENSEKYRKEIQELKKIHEEQKEIIRKLEEKIKTLRITKTIETKEGAVEAKERITKLVREIDNCIGLLNT